VTIARRTAEYVAHQAAIWVGALLLVIPFLWMISTSLKPSAEIFSPTWLPSTIEWGNYTRALTEIPVLLYARNTVFITILCIVGYLVSGSMVAYAFSRLRWPGRDAWFLVMLSTMMLPPQVTIVPSFVIFRQLGWINTYYPLIVPAFLSGWPFFIFLMRQFFLTIPQDLAEAAKIDGASHFMVYRTIMLPLAKPALATVAIFAFFLHWNDFFGPLIYLTEDSKFTLALGLMTFAAKHQNEWSQLMAVSIVMLLPSLVVFFLCQRYFVEGIATTGSKG